MDISTSPRGWHSRGYLPHFDPGDILQFITLRLADSVPIKVIEKWKTQLFNEPEEESRRILEERIERYLDCGYGACWLGRSGVATIVENSLKHFDGRRYQLYSWVIMPNHTHFIIRPRKGFGLSEILKSHKSYTARESNKLIGRRGQFWQEDYFDRTIRDLGHMIDTTSYIDFNPVKAGLCKKPEDWRFGSARLSLKGFRW